MTTRGPETDHRQGELTSIAASIQPAFPDAATTLRAIAASLTAKKPRTAPATERIHGPNGALSASDQKALLGVVDEFHDERVRQATDLGYTTEHDDDHHPQDMIDLTVTYLQRADNDMASWPSDQRVSEARDNLVKAAALIAATITRLDREVSRG